jgi:ribulose-phosphate 3-epimerase
MAGVPGSASLARRLPWRRLGAVSPVLIAPSILSADFARLGEEVTELERSGADWVHVDVMDGRFVPNLTIGPLVVKALRRVTKLPLDVHLMIENPERYVESFAAAGADVITVHVEATRHLHRLIQQIKGLKVRAGVALNPATPPEVLSEILGDVDLVLVMSVNPGFGGQSFIPQALGKIARLRGWLGEIKSPAELEVDGGVNSSTVQSIVAAGASLLVAGSAIFSEGDSIGLAIAALRRRAEQASGD